MESCTHEMNLRFAIDKQKRHRRGNKEDIVGIENYLPKSMEISKTQADKLEEIRVRINKPIELITGDTIAFGEKKVTGDEMEELLNYLTDYSWFNLASQIRQGFFTVRGGHRVGIVGRAGIYDERIESINDISGVNIRVAHEYKNCAREIMPYIRRADDIYDTLFVSPPGVGKTTYIRDAIRIIASGCDGSRAMKVAVVDERSEIAACYRGVPQNDLGGRCDVLDNCPKAKGMRILLRSMSPQIIAVDELGGTEDERAVELSRKSGVRILGTIHAKEFKELDDKGMTYLADRFVFLKKGEHGERSFSVCDNRGNMVC